MSEETAELDEQERQELLDLYEGLRVADVSDAFDYMGYHDLNLAANDIDPVYRDEENLDHHVVGFAHTVRYHPTNRKRTTDEIPQADLDNGEQMGSNWVSEISPYSPIDEGLQDGDIVVVEAHSLKAGIVGSANSLRWLSKGANGVVTNGGCRDTDEVIKEEVPVYSKHMVRPHPHGRTELDAVGVPVNLDGCLVRPNDMIVADGDGAMVVPKEHAREAGEIARKILDIDKEARKEIYEDAGKELDFTVES